MQLQTVCFFDGHWLTGGYHWKIPNAYVSNRYKLIPLDGSPDPSDGEYKGFIVRENVLRIAWGGEHYAGTTINHRFTDYKLEHCREDYDQYEAGLFRGYYGKRACTEDYRWRQTAKWRAGYEEGRRVKLEELHNKKNSQTIAA